MDLVSEHKLVRSELDVSDSYCMSYHADAEFDRSTRTHSITVTATKGEKILHSIRQVDSESASACVCHVSMMGRHSCSDEILEEHTTGAGESIVSLSIARNQAYKHLVVLDDDGRVLDVADVRGR